MIEGAVIVFGATSKIAIDVVGRLTEACPQADLYLYSRDPVRCADIYRASCSIEETSDFKFFSYDDFGRSFSSTGLAINFVGKGSPEEVEALDQSFVDDVLYLDSLLLEWAASSEANYYINVSSGIVYEEEADYIAEDGGPLSGRYFYRKSKVQTELNHSISTALVSDLRIFCYCSDKPDVYGKFFVDQILAAIRNRQNLEIRGSEFNRDFVGSEEIFDAITELASEKFKGAVDISSKSPITKSAILKISAEKYGLCYHSNHDRCTDPVVMQYRPTEDRATRIIRGRRSSEEVIVSFLEAGL